MLWGFMPDLEDGGYWLVMMTNIPRGRNMTGHKFCTERFEHFEDIETVRIIAIGLNITERANARLRSKS
jgi:hypothetical protein